VGTCAGCRGAASSGATAARAVALAVVRALGGDLEVAHDLVDVGRAADEAAQHLGHARRRSRTERRRLEV